MIEIINEKNITLELSDDFTLSIERNNPIFQQGNTFFDDITYPGKVGLTDQNIIFVKSGHLLEADSSVYEFPVTIFRNGALFSAGLFLYEIIENEISFILKTNYASIAKLADETKITDITYNFAPFPMFTLDTLENPGNHDFSCFPVHFKGVDENSNPIDAFVNEYNYDQQKPARDNADVPYIKMTFVLKTIIEHLGLEPVGSFFSNQEMNAVFIYSELKFQGLNADARMYLPAISISDFIKIIRGRFNVAMHIDTAKKQFEVFEPNQALHSNEIYDLSEYVSEVKAINRKDKVFYMVSLKEETDDAYSFLSVNDGTVFNKEEIKVPVRMMLKHTMGTYSCPSTKIIPHQPPVAHNPSKENSWDLSFLYYPGMKLQPGGKKYPQAEVMALSAEQDGRWYEFLNDSKPVKIQTFLPSAVLEALNQSKKIGFISEQGVFKVALIKTMHYSFSNENSELIEVIIEANVFMNKKSKSEILFYIKSPVELKPPLHWEIGKF